MKPEEPSLFPEETGALATSGRTGATERAPRVAVDPSAPLAARMRPRSLDEFVGQEELVGPGRPLRELIETGQVPSLILWGPPGSGKTTLAGLLAIRCNATFVPFSAVTEGIPRVRQVIAEARERRLAANRGTVLFVDEIHRFNRAQQDALLPHVERGTVTLIGATTENPSFEVVGPLLSRTRVLVLDPLSPEELEEICRRALADTERGLGESAPSIANDALKRITIEADGDARRALNALETAAAMSGEEEIQVSTVEAALQKRFARYDKSGEEHYNLISALHKAVRGSDPDGALYWLSRMLEAGEDPMYIARRLVRMASEDIGLADPAALSVCVAARDAYHFLGSPEGELALAQATAYLAMVPKSNAVYRAFGVASEAARETPAEGVPLHLRNAPTRLMRDLGYGRDYLYDHSYEEGVAPQTYLPERLSGRRFYTPSGRGWEAEASQRLDEVETARHGEVDPDEPRAPSEEADGGSRDAGEASRGRDR
jgi:putative ATPase